MTFERQFRISSHCLALIGVAALETTHQVSVGFILAATASLVWSLGRGWVDRGFELSTSLANGATLVALVLIFAPVYYADAQPIRAIAEFMLLLGAIKGLAPKQNRDWLQIYVLSFFQLVAASALTVEPVFALLFVLYLLFAPWVLVLFCLRRELESAGQGQRLSQERFVEPSLFQAVASVTVLLFVSTLVIFVLFPRVGAGYFSSPLSSGSALTGFSDEVGLGEVTALKSDESVAMRVTASPPDRLRDQPLYWRGAALDRFDGRRWHRGAQPTRGAARPEPSLFVVAESGAPQSLVREEIILEPTQSNTLFAAGRPIEFRGRFSAVIGDALENYRSIGPTGVRLRYEVLAALTPREAPPSRSSRDLPDAVAPRVVELARATAGSLPDPAARAGALFELLQRGFAYTSEPGDPGNEDPLVRFLFETRRGHCEYFASSFAVMLRAVGIPSLVVTGYHGGEWNPYGDYYLVRQSDAHSWVEAWIGGRWQLFDPTPPSLSASRLRQGGLGAMLDAYRMRWYRYVINYNFGDQMEIAVRIRDSSRHLREDLRSGIWQGGWGWLLQGFSSARTEHSRGLARLAPFLALLAVAVAIFLVVRARRSRAPGAESQATVRYLELLRVLARRGIVKRAAETPDEFVDRIAPSLDGVRGPVARITELYQEARFSGHEPTVALPEIDRLLDELSERR